MLFSRSFAYTGVCRLQFRPLTKFEPLTENKKYLTTDRCVTYCGLILKVSTKYSYVALSNK